MILPVLRDSIACVVFRYDTDTTLPGSVDIVVSHYVPSAGNFDAISAVWNTRLIRVTDAIIFDKVEVS